MTINSSRMGAQQNSGGNGGVVEVVQSGSIVTSGAGAVGIVAQSVGGGGGYLGIVSKDSSAAINSSSLVMGAASGSSGNGGAVTVTNNSLIRTSGANAIGILAQSVGGGGGIVMVSGSGTITPTWGAGTGYGGNVTVNVNSPIYTTGAGAYGVVAESVGGGGGLAISGTSVTDDGGYGRGFGGEVIINVNAPIYASGRGAMAIYGHSISGSADPAVTVAAGQTVSATDGASAIILDGGLNSLTNRGSVLGINNAATETALETRGNGVTALNNYGLFTGNVKATTGTITATNHTDGTFIAGSIINLGSSSNLFTNNGYFEITPSSTSTTTSTNINGSFVQNSSGTTLVRMDLPENRMDQYRVTGGANLAGTLRPDLQNTSFMAPGTVTQNVFITGSPAIVDPNLIFINNSIMMSYAAAANINGISVAATTNFAPAGMSNFSTQVGSSIGSMQTAGSSPFFGTVTSRLIATQSSIAQLDQTYTALAGTAISAVPQVNYEAVNRSIANFSDRMNSWRVGDGFVATSNSNQNSLVNNFIKVGMPTASLGSNDELPSAKKKAGDFRTWITPFQGDASTNTLSNRVYGASVGLEVDSADGKTFGGVGFTVSQSNYNYTTSLTPTTSGSSTNYGASFYVGAKNDHAYVTAIGYFGGSNTTFNRQLQTLGFNMSTNVNIHSTVIGGRVEAGYNIFSNADGKRQFQLTPFVAFQPTQILQNGTNENFIGYGTGFSYGANTNTALPVFVGAELSGDINMKNGSKFLPFLRISWVSDTANSSAMGASYGTATGPTIYSNGSPSFGSAMIYKAGAKYHLDNKVSGYFTLDVEQGNKTYNYRGIGGTVGLRYSWH
jgi:uncharacterized protein with beta-barrel porin domain